MYVHELSSVNSQHRSVSASLRRRPIMYFYVYISQTDSSEFQNHKSLDIFVTDLELVDSQLYNILKTTLL